MELWDRLCWAVCVYLPYQPVFSNLICYLDLLVQNAWGKLFAVSFLGVHKGELINHEMLYSFNGMGLDRLLLFIIGVQYVVAQRKMAA